MGSGLINQYARPHYQIINGTLTRQGLAWRIHHGNNNVDVVLSECNPTEWATLEGTSTQLIFNNAASTIWGSAFDNLSVAAKAGMRQVIDAGLP